MNLEADFITDDTAETLGLLRAEEQKAEIIISLLRIGLYGFFTILGIVFRSFS